MQKPFVILAGAAGSIGQQIARQLAPNYSLGLLDLNADGLAALQEELGGSTRFRAADLADAADVEAAFAQLTEGCTLNAVVNAAGTTSGGSLESLSTEEWSQCLDSCLTSTFLLMRESLRCFGDEGGALCILGSVHAANPIPGFPAYGAAKAGVTALVKQVAAEYGHRGIRANLVVPGWTETEHTRSRSDPEDRSRIADATPLRQLVEPADIAAAVDFLISPAARRITGSELVVDGGANLLTGAGTLRDSSRALLGLNSSTVQS
ncbi:SDR family NAD(P)-dependent oxidoreductase [Arthrobacter tecti]